MIAGAILVYAVARGCVQAFFPPDDPVAVLIRVARLHGYEAREITEGEYRATLGYSWDGR